LQRRILVLLALSPALASSYALAGPREDTLAGISRCAHYGDDRSYLDCIYGAVQPLRASLGLPPALPAQLRLVPPVLPETSQSVPPPTAIAPATGTASRGNGFLGRLFAAGDSELRMSAYTFDKRGLFTVTLSNGEVWAQDANDTSYAQFGGRASDYVVALTDRGSGSAIMDVRGEPGTFIVRRVH
jgi:hypothetical protein